MSRSSYAIQRRSERIRKFDVIPIILGIGKTALNAVQILELLLAR